MWRAIQRSGRHRCAASSTSSLKVLADPFDPYGPSFLVELLKSPEYMKEYGEIRPPVHPHEAT